ncbi:hypothetical protein BROUX41_004803 [Berkeleyomyces rouxiae]|uniref:uncharacterized protein n=1 Tax=Berkeleyomyces rouxiae TaxID=2035830 RepID=UPI003B7EBD0D
MANSPESQNHNQPLPPSEVEHAAQDIDADDQMNDGQEHGGVGLGFDFEVKEQDRWLPIANVARIMKNALPENAKIAKEAKECMQECVSEFISFITSEASEKCHQEKRKTVNGEDIIFAMTSLGFENYAEALKIYLAKYRDTQTPRDPVPRPTSQEFVSNSGPNISDFDSGGAQPSFPTGEPSDTGAEANFTYSSAATGAGGEPSF